MVGLGFCAQDSVWGSEAVTEGLCISVLVQEIIRMGFRHLADVALQAVQY